MKTKLKTATLFIVILMLISSCASNIPVTKVSKQPKKEKRQKVEYTPTKMDKLANILFIACIPIILSIEIFD